MNNADNIKEIAEMDAWNFFHQFKKQGFMTTDLYTSWENSFLMGEFGLNAIAGIEFAFSKAVALSFDFRPGYGLAYRSGGTGSFFDWGLQLGLRFYL